MLRSMSTFAPRDLSKKGQKIQPQEDFCLLWLLVFWPLRAWVRGITGGLVAGEGFEPTTKGL